MIKKFKYLFIIPLSIFLFSMCVFAGESVEYYQLEASSNNVNFYGLYKKEGGGAPTPLGRYIAVDVLKNEFYSATAIAGQNSFQKGNKLEIPPAYQTTTFINSTDGSITKIVQQFDGTTKTTTSKLNDKGDRIVLNDGEYKGENKLSEDRLNSSWQFTDSVLEGIRRAEDPRIQITEDSAAVIDLCLLIDKYADTLDTFENHIDGYGIVILNYTSDNVLSFSKRAYSRMTYDQKKKFMKYALESIRDYPSFSQNSSARIRFYNFVENQDNTIVSALKFLKSDTKADYVTAKDILEHEITDEGIFNTPMDIIATILGLLSFGGILDARISNKKGRTRPPFISFEAQYSMKQADTGEEFYLLIYFKKRIHVFLIIGVCLLLLLSGGLLRVMTAISQVFYGVFIIK